MTCLGDYGYLKLHGDNKKRKIYLRSKIYDRSNKASRRSI